MNIIYLYSRIEDDLQSSGEAKKAIMQTNALRANGLNTQIIYHNRNIRNNKVLIRLPFLPIYSRRFIKELCSILIHKKINAIYIRKYVIDYSFIRLLKMIRKTNPKISIIFEIPTYPYDKEWSGIIDLPLLVKDKINRKKLQNYVDRIVTFSNDNRIFGVNCINTSNGIDPNDISVRHVEKRNSANQISLLGVAKLEKWHGYDRVIRGLYKYYQKNNNHYKVVFNVVGDGAELNNLKKLSMKLGLQKYVVFHGPKRGDELTSFFNNSDIGIGSLGMYRISLFDGYALKLREYMARGLPFVYGYNDRLIEQCNSRYYLKVQNNNDAIDIDKIVSFYNDVYSMDQVEKNMRIIAEQRLTWNSQMRPIAEFVLKKGNKND